VPSQVSFHLPIPQTQRPTLNYRDWQFTSPQQVFCQDTTPILPFPSPARPSTPPLQHASKREHSAEVLVAEVAGDVEELEVHLQRV
jgi:hypothetical protein